MSKAFESIKQGLTEAISHATGAPCGVKTYTPRPVNVKVLRSRVKMTQQQFAARFGFSVAAVRHWERGDRVPNGPSLVLLNVIEKDSAAVLNALRA